LLTRHIRNGYYTRTVTITSHRSREVTCFSGPTGNFGNRHQSTAHYNSSISETLAVHLRLHYLDKLRHVYFTRVSAHIGFVTGIKQRPLPQLVTGHMKWLFLCAHRKLW
jgi:hypothetical protein